MKNVSDIASAQPAANASVEESLDEHVWEYLTIDTRLYVLEAEIRWAFVRLDGETER